MRGAELPTIETRDDNNQPCSKWLYKIHNQTLYDTETRRRGLLVAVDVRRTGVS